VKELLKRKNINAAVLELPAFGTTVVWIIKKSDGKLDFYHMNGHIFGKNLEFLYPFGNEDFFKQQGFSSLDEAVEYAITKFKLPPATTRLGYRLWSGTLKAFILDASSKPAKKYRPAY